MSNESGSNKRVFIWFCYAGGFSAQMYIWAQQIQKTKRHGITNIHIIATQLRTTPRVIQRHQHRHVKTQIQLPTPPRICKAQIIKYKKQD